MRVHDSNRRALRDAYHPDARFSDQCWSSSPSSSGPSYVPYNPLVSPRSLGLQRVGSKTEVTPSLASFVQGPNAIVDHLLTMRRWAHASPPSDLYSREDSSPRFVWDVTPLPPAIWGTLAPSREGPQDDELSWRTGMMITCHGDLVDQDNFAIAASFDRTFVLKENTNKSTRWAYPGCRS